MINEVSETQIPIINTQSCDYESRIPDADSPVLSSEIAISVCNLSKKYLLYDTPQHRLQEALHPFRKKFHREFLALRDVSFEVMKGEIIGIIGQNGSGKSTLVSIIAGTRTPSEGSVEVNGRISALLELGAGFKPELTGIENIYFSGSIMGYSKGEIDSKLDDILSFADIGDFVHQPVKVYSSGMFMRLAFAVNSCVDPDILIIDEAMAVGDSRFVKKCFDRINGFKEIGKTIVLVTHDVESVKAFCQKAIYLENGRVAFCGEPKEAVARYLRMMFPVQDKIDFSKRQMPETGRQINSAAETATEYCLEITEFGTSDIVETAQFEFVRVHGLDIPNIFHGGECLKIVLKAVWNSKRLFKLIYMHGYPNNLMIGLRFQNKKGMNIYATNTFVHDIEIETQNHSQCRMTIDLTMPNLCRDDYFISLTISLGTKDTHYGLLTCDNLIHLVCVPHDRNIFFGLMQLEHKITEVILDCPASVGNGLSDRLSY